MAKASIAETAIVNDYVQMGEDSVIRGFCNVYGTSKEPVIIGNNTQIGAHSEIKPGVIIGDNCRFQPYVFLPEGTQIGNYVFIGPGAKFANDKYPTAEKAIEGDWGLSEVVVEDRAVIGLGALIAPGVRIGHYAVVGLGATVFRDVNPFSIVKGNPAEVIGDVRSKRYRNRFHLPPEIFNPYQGD